MINPLIGPANAQYKLWCIVEDDTAPFWVTVPTNAYIDDLKESIKEECKHGILKDVDATDLVLWKASTFYALTSPLKQLRKSGRSENRYLSNRPKI
jgi:hypothetical protein